QSSALVEPRRAMIDCPMRDAWARDESAQRAKFLIDAVHAVAESKPLAVAHETHVPERRVPNHAARLVVALRELECTAVDLAEDHASIDVGDTIVVVANDAIGVRHPNARLSSEVALRAHDVVIGRVGA